MSLWSPTDGHIPGAFSGLGIRTVLAGRIARARPRFLSSSLYLEEDIMDKWKIVAESKIARVGASAATLIAVAAVVGAGWKWG